MGLKDVSIALAVFAVNLLLAPALFVAVGAFGLPWWAATAILAFWAWLMLPGTTWRDFAAGMTAYRVRRGGGVTLPPEEERCLEPDHERLIAWQLQLPAVARNFLFNATWGWLYFGDPPREIGFTPRMNRYAALPDGHELKAKGWKVAVRWLHRFDSRGRHT